MTRRRVIAPPAHRRRWGASRFRDERPDRRTVTTRDSDSHDRPADRILESHEHPPVNGGPHHHRSPWMHRSPARVGRSDASPPREVITRPTRTPAIRHTTNRSRRKRGDRVQRARGWTGALPGGGCRRGGGVDSRQVDRLSRAAQRGRGDRCRVGRVEAEVVPLAHGLWRVIAPLLGRTSHDARATRPAPHPDWLRSSHPVGAPVPDELLAG